MKHVQFTKQLRNQNVPCLWISLTLHFGLKIHWVEGSSLESLKNRVDLVSLSFFFNLVHKSG